MELPNHIIAGLRSVCLALPEVREEPAWTGVRWRIRGRTFAHVLVIDSGWPPAYARAANTCGPSCVLMFRSAGPELAALRHVGGPFFAPPWRREEVGVMLDDVVDWVEIAELITESYRALAPVTLREAALDPGTSDPPA